MAVTQLASQADVEAALGRDLTSDEVSRVGAILDKASELFRRRSGQTFTADRSEVRRQVTGGKVYLPQRPVTTVHSLVDADGDTVEYTLFKQWLLDIPLVSGAFVTVDYSHGGDVPDVVRLCIADIARKVLSIDPNAVNGVTQKSETAGPMTEQYTYAAWAVGGQTMLAPDDAALADSFRRRLPSLIVQRP